MQVIARQGDPLVVEVDGGLVEGWVPEPGCPRCGGRTVYFLAYDAIGCPACNVWLAFHCPEPDCIHCRIRPERPWAGSA